MIIKWSTILEMLNNENKLISNSKGRLENLLLSIIWMIRKLIIQTKKIIHNKIVY
jgi:hypothetical protein